MHVALPPAWYAFLLGALALAAPLLLRGLHGAARTHVQRLLAGLALYAAGLALLFYDKLLCWPLVTAGIGVLASIGQTRPVTTATSIAVPALAAGLAFQLLPGEEGFYFYFGLALPLLLLVALGLAWTGPLRWRHDPPMLAAVAAVLAFATFTPASGFAFTFLRHYEIFHLPLLVLALAATWWLTRRGAAGIRAEETEARNRHTPGDRAVRNVHLGRTAALLVVSGALVKAPMIYAAPLDPTLRLVAWVLLVAALLVAAIGLAGARQARPLLPIAALAGALASGLGTRAGAAAFQSLGGGPAFESLFFYLGSLGLTLLAMGGVLGLAAWRDARNLSRAARTRDAGSGTALRRTTIATIPAPAELDAHRARLDAQDVGAILEVLAPHDPLAPLPRSTEQWLLAQPPGPRLHLALREGRETFYVPALPEDDAA